MSVWHDLFWFRKFFIGIIQMKRCDEFFYKLLLLLTTWSTSIHTFFFFSACNTAQYNEYTYAVHYWDSSESGLERQQLSRTTSLLQPPFLFSVLWGIPTTTTLVVFCSFSRTDLSCSCGKLWSVSKVRNFSHDLKSLVPGSKILKYFWEFNFLILQ